jgi:hypothetical protein
MQHIGREQAALRALLRAVWGEELLPEPPKARAPRFAGRAVVGFGMLFLVMAVAPLGANATQGTPEHKVTLCHATDSYTNPYVEITVDVASVIKNHGHGNHDGPVFYPTIPKHTKWGDIIPPFDFGGAGSYPGKNWTPQGRAIFDDGCNVESPTTTTPITAPVTTSTLVVGSSTTITTPPSSTSTTLVSPTTAPATTTTTISDATSTSQPSTQTTQGSGSSTTVAIGSATSVHAAGVTTTTDPDAAASTASPPTSSSTSGPLAFTGSPALPLAIAGVALIGAGLGIEARRRRRTSSQIRSE